MKSKKSCFHYFIVKIIFYIFQIYHTKILGLKSNKIQVFFPDSDDLIVSYYPFYWYYTIHHNIFSYQLFPLLFHQRYYYIFYIIQLSVSSELPNFNIRIITFYRYVRYIYLIYKFFKYIYHIYILQVQILCTYIKKPKMQRSNRIINLE